MSTPLSPRLLKCGLVQVDPGTGQVLRTISSIVDREKPAHTEWSYAFSYLENLP